MLKRPMKIHHTAYRVIYGDTDAMGVVYNSNYLRLFEIGRNEFFRDLGLPYRGIEGRGLHLPVSETFCKFVSPARYDDLLEIETRIDPKVRAGLKFDYQIYKEEGNILIARGYTKHAFVNSEGRVVRPPDYVAELIAS